MKEFQLSSSDGLMLHGKHWLPAEPSKGIVQIAHGMAEHIDRYDSFARYLTQNGYEVYGHNHRGHGKTAGNEANLGYLAPTGGWDLMVDDFIEVTRMIQESAPDKKLFLLGHSMGSFVVRDALRRGTLAFDGAIIMGSSWQSPVKVKAGQLTARIIRAASGAKARSKLMDIMLFGNYCNRISDPQSSFDWLSRDPEMVRKYVDDPYCGFICTAGFYSDLMDGLSRVMKTKGLEGLNKSLPVLLMSGDGDPVGQYGAGLYRLRDNYLKTGLYDVRLKLYKGGRHELLNEMNRTVVFEDILDWLDKQVEE